MPGPFQVNKHFHWQQFQARLRAEREAEAARRAAAAEPAIQQTEETAMSDQPTPTSMEQNAMSEAEPTAPDSREKMEKMEEMEKMDRDPKTGRFQPGWSGGPGRPPSQRSRMAIKLDELADARIEAIMAATLERAEKGEAAATRMVLDRRWPKHPARAPAVDLPDGAKADDVLAMLSALVRAAAQGELTPAEAAQLGTLAGHRLKALQLIEFEGLIMELREIQEERRRERDR